MTTEKQPGFDASKPFYAWIGAGDLALARVRKAAGDLTSHLASQVDEVRAHVLDAARGTRGAARQAQARVLEQLGARLDELSQEARDSQTKVESRIAELQAEALGFPQQAQSRVEEVQAEVRALVERFEARAVELREQLAAASREQLEAYDRLATRGETVVSRARETDAGQS